MKKVLFLIAIVALVLAAFGPMATAYAHGPDWDKSSLSAKAQCLANGHVLITVKNGGSGNMGGSTSYWVSSTGYINTGTPSGTVGPLAAGASQTFEYLGTGQVYFTVAQRPGHPGTGFARADAGHCTQPATPTNTSEPTATNTLESTATNTSEPTATNTLESTATNTSEPTATNTLESTATNTDTGCTEDCATATNTLVPSTATLGATATSTDSPAATETLVVNSGPVCSDSIIPYGNAIWVGFGTIDPKFEAKYPNLVAKWKANGQLLQDPNGFWGCYDPKNPAGPSNTGSEQFDLWGWLLSMFGIK